MELRPRLGYLRSLPRFFDPDSICASRDLTGLYVLTRCLIWLHFFTQVIFWILCLGGFIHPKGVGPLSVCMCVYTVFHHSTRLRVNALSKKKVSCRLLIWLVTSSARKMFGVSFVSNKKVLNLAVGTHTLCKVYGRKRADWFFYGKEWYLATKSQLWSAAAGGVGLTGLSVRQAATTQCFLSDLTWSTEGSA